jgi:hypothetical protein
MHWRSSSRLALALALTTTAAVLSLGVTASAQTLSNGYFKVAIGASGEISSLQLTGDAFPTNYVLNGTNAPAQNTADHEWVGELMFSYRVGGGAWATALTNQSTDVRAIATAGGAVTVTYQGSASPNGIRNFKVVETYALVNDYLSWQITVTNTAAQALEIGDFGLPLPFNEFWKGGDVIYETRTVYHSFVGGSSSYVTVMRPSGIPPFLLMVPDPTTGAGFEYMDSWVAAEHPNSTWVAGGGTPAWQNGLDVFYIHSNVIKSTGRGYLPNTSLTLAPGASKTYAFKLFNVASHDDVKSRLYAEGLVDVSVVPSLIVATNMAATVDLHTSKPIGAVTAQYPSQTTIKALGAVATDHNLYQVTFGHLGQNNVTVGYGNGETTTLQFYVLEPIDAAIQRHATFIVSQTQWTTGDMKGLFDDWMMDTRARRGLSGGSGWGDDWGWTHGQFLAEKNAATPVAAEVTALDNYLDAVWSRAIDHASYVVQDWWCPAGTSASNPQNCFYNRPYAYPHAFNTFFSMYKIASLYPGLVSYHNAADTYLLRAYNILHALYSGGPPAPKMGTIIGTGYMGEQTLPELQAALTAAGHTAEATFVGGAIDQMYAAFAAAPYPYGSEYTYDNTGEEAVYMAAKQHADRSILGKVDAKTRACRGQQPVWYHYADPVTLNGENWWQFQYTAALAGAGMDDWVRSLSTSPALDERLAWAAKIANVSAINSGQIDGSSANLGTVAWTYQAAKGSVYMNSFDPAGSMLHGGWRQMSGEADLGLFGALRILSADVAVDPIFGLTGYGCNVAQQDGCTVVTPTDGVFKRLNLVSQRLSLQLDRDRYSSASVGASNDALGFVLQNQLAASPHLTHATITGLAPGTYAVTVGGASAGTVTASAGAPTVLALNVGTNATYQVQIGSGCTVTSTGAGGAGGASGAGGGVGGAGGAGAGGAAGAGSSGGAAGSDAGGSTGGVSGAGGAASSGTGGASAAGETGGAAGSGAGGRPGPGGEPVGCSCEAAGRGGAGGARPLLLGLALIVLARRKRRPGRLIARR